MKRQLFRKTSLEKVSSPEQLNDYVKVANPGVWMILAATIILLAGVCVWGIFGKLDTCITAAGVVENKTLTCYIKESDISSVEVGTMVKVNKNEYEISSVSKTPEAVTDAMDDYVKYVGSLQNGEWVCSVTAEAPEEPDGVYQTSIIVEQISPMSFVFN